MKKYFLFLLFLFFRFISFSQAPFITTWKTDNAGVSNSTSIIIPTTGGGYNYDVDWDNDGVFDDFGISGNVTHDFGIAGTYTIGIRGDFSRIFFNNEGDRLKILSIEQWGEIFWTSFVNSFFGCSNLVNNALDTPFLSNVTGVSEMFAGCTSLGTGSAINWSFWDMTTITSTRAMFSGASNFNENIANWNTSNVVGMENMFLNATSFDQNISGWNVANVNNMMDMFLGATLSTTNYESLLVGWDSQVLQPNINFHGGNSTYCSVDAQNARANMIASDNWTIIDGGIASYIWTGNTNSDWNEITNWNTECSVLPTSLQDVTIPNVATQPEILLGTNANTNNLTINTLASLTIQGDANLTVAGNQTNNGTFTVNSGGSLIVNGTSVGDIIYNRNLPQDNWFLVSSPVTGETIEDYIANNPISTGNGNVGLIYFDNNINTGFNDTGWVFFEPSSVGPLILGKGYGTRIANAGNISFIGSMPVNDVSIALTDGTETNDDGLNNFIGNPFPSYLPANFTADGTNNILTVNSTQLFEETIWLWDNTSYSYIAINQASASRFIAPSQGFFVKTIAGGGIFSMNENMQSHQADVFTRTSTDQFKIRLQLTDGGGFTKFTDVFFLKNTTEGFDNGYDSTTLNTEDELAIYTKIVADNDDKSLAIQSLVDANYEELIIPIGINAKESTTLTFTAIISNLPSGLKLYLEDRELDIFTQLDVENSNYLITTTRTINGFGRFYLRTSTSRLSVDTAELSDEILDIYKKSNNSIRIVGIRSEKILVQLFDLLGKEIYKKHFLVDRSTKNVNFLHLSKGVYLVHISANNKRFSKKIYIE